MSNRAFCKGAVVTYKPEPYLDRNHYMVDRCNLLIACPEGIEALRSGTWATVRYARKRPRNHLIIYPDGTTFEQLYPARS